MVIENWTLVITDEIIKLVPTYFKFNKIKIISGPFNFS